MKDWNFSVLTKNASLHGGPEKYIEYIKGETRTATNKKWIKRSIPTLLILTPLAIKGIATIAKESIPKFKEHLNPEYEQQDDEKNHTKNS